MEDQTRNINPLEPLCGYLASDTQHNAVATWNFWDRLSQSNKRLCRKMVDDIEKSPCESAVDYPPLPRPRRKQAAGEPLGEAIITRRRKHNER